jgi:hypothetical protein
VEFKSNLPIIEESPSEETKDAFRQFAQEKVVIFDDTEECDRFILKWMFNNKYGHTTRTERSPNCPGQALLDKDSGNKNSKTTRDFVIIINRQSFIINNQDFSDLIPLVIEHEIMELWYDLKEGFPPLSSHSLAITEETKLAVKLDKAERLFKFHDLITHGKATNDLELMERIINKRRDRA